MVKESRYLSLEVVSPSYKRATLVVHAMDNYINIWVLKEERKMEGRECVRSVMCEGARCFISGLDVTVGRNADKKAKGKERQWEWYFDIGK